MNLIINGKKIWINTDIQYLDQLIEDLHLKNQRIALELNGNIIPRSQFAKTKIEQNNKIEIIKAVGGG